MMNYVIEADDFTRMSKLKCMYNCAGSGPKSKVLIE